jgi:DNA-binding NarL/FixJ family response regulator
LIKLIKAERPKMPVLIFSMHQEEQICGARHSCGCFWVFVKSGGQ